MKKSELVLAIAAEAGLTKADAERALNAFVLTVRTEVEAGNKVNIAGIGSFEKVFRKARKGVNPSTGESITIAAKHAPKFKAAKPFKDLVA